MTALAPMVVAHADAPFLFSATARADGLDVTGSDPAIVPLGLVAEASGPSAQAHLDSLGNSTAFASYPYPGSTAAAAPDTARGNGAPVPDLPYTVATTNDSEAHRQAKTDAPGYTLRAKSADDSAIAQALGGLASDAQSVGRTEARSTVSLTSGGVTAAAEATDEGFELAGVLRLGRVDASATAVRHADGTLSRTSDLAVGEATVAGQRVALTPQGLAAAGQSVPLPGNPIDSILKQAGIAVTYLAPVTLSDGVMSAGMQVVVTQTDPNGGTVTATYTFGRASAFAGGSPRVGAAPPPTSTTPAASPASRPATGAGSTTGSSTGVSGSTAGPVTLPGVPPPAAGDVVSPPSVAEALSPAPAPTVAPALAASVRPTVVLSTGFYLILVLAAVAGLGGLTLLRILGVRSAWSS